MRRLFEDPEQPQAVRDELMRSRAAGRDYPAEHKLAQLQAALADSSRQVDAPTEVGHGFTMRASHPAWKLALVAAVSGGAVAWLTWPAPQPVRSTELRALAPAQPAEPAPVPQPTAAESPVAAVPSRTAAEPPSAAVGPTAAEPTSSPVAPTAAEPTSAVVAPTVTGPTSAPVVPPTAAEPAARGDKPAVAAEYAATGAPARETAGKSSRREIAQLIRIRSLLKSDPAAALRLAERSEREFPGGLLSEERRALSIVALAKTGARESAAAKAREFFERYPQSPMRGLIEAELQR